MVKYPFKCIYMSWIFRNRRGGKVSRLTPSSVKTNCTKYSNVFRKQHSSFRRYVKDHVYAPECIRKTSSVCLRRSVRTCRRSSSSLIVHKVNLKTVNGWQQSRPALLSTPSQPSDTDAALLWLCSSGMMNTFQSSFSGSDRGRLAESQEISHIASPERSIINEPSSSTCTLCHIPDPNDGRACFLCFTAYRKKQKKNFLDWDNTLD